MSGSTEWFYITFKFGGYWSTVGKTNKKKYEGGKQKTIKIDKDVLSYFVLVEEIERLCPWIRGHGYSFYYQIYDTSPKEYKHIQNDSDVMEIVRLSNKSDRLVIVILTRDGSNHEFLPHIHHTPSAREDIMNAEREVGTSQNQMFEYYQSSSDSDGHLGDMLGTCIDTQLADPVKDDNIVLAVGTRFPNAMSFKQFIRTKAIDENFGVKMLGSNKKRVIAACSYMGCPWRVRASACRDGETFEVRKIEGLHLCPGINRAGNRQATSSWISFQIQELVKKNPDIPPKQIKDELERKYGLSVPYMKLWRSREIARDIVFGSIDKSYKWVPALKEELVRRNPGSHIIFEYDNHDNSFKRFFVSFKVCVEGFLAGCRPLVGVDVCHLKSKYLGMLLSANSLDGNSGLFTLSFAVVETESKGTWQWFLENLLTSFGHEVSPLAFISDMEKGLGEAIKIVFPAAEHRVCIRHLWKNIKKSHFCHDSQKIHSLVWSAAHSYTWPEFDAKVQEISRINPAVYSYLHALPYKWSRCQFWPEIKNDSLTNNMSESFNSWITSVRGKPIVDLINIIRGMIMEQRATRKANSLDWRGDLVPTAEEYIRAISTKKEHFIIRQENSYMAEVEGHFDTYEVNIQQKECTCRYWQITGLPCIHAAAFIGTKEIPLWNIYVDEHYYVSRYTMAYDGTISTMPGKKHWNISNDEIQIGAPNTVRPRGRPRKRRLKSFLEGSQCKMPRVHKCSRCGSWGHHKNTCKSPLVQSQTQFPEVDVGAYCSELPFNDFGRKGKLPVRRGQTEECSNLQI